MNFPCTHCNICGLFSFLHIALSFNSWETFADLHNFTYLVSIIHPLQFQWQVLLFTRHSRYVVSFGQIFSFILGWRLHGHVSGRLREFALDVRKCQLFWCFLEITVVPFCLCLLSSDLQLPGIWLCHPKAKTISCSWKQRGK